MRYSSEIHLKLASREVSFAHNLCRYPIVLEFGSEHKSHVALCKISKWLDKCNGWYEQRTKFREIWEFMNSFGRISYIAHPFVIKSQHSEYGWVGISNAFPYTSCKPLSNNSRHIAFYNLYLNEVFWCQWCSCIDAHEEAYYSLEYQCYRNEKSIVWSSRGVLSFRMISDHFYGSKWQWIE